METLNEENVSIEYDDCNQLGGGLPVMSRVTRVSEQDANAMVGFRSSEVDDTVIVSGGSRVSEQEGAAMASGETRVSEQDVNVMVAGEFRVSEQEDIAMASGRTRVLQQAATVILPGGIRVSQHEANVMVLGANRVSEQEAMAMAAGDNRVSEQAGALYLACRTDGVEHFTGEDITREDPEEGRVATLSALEGAEFDYDTDFNAAQFVMDTQEEEPVIGTFSDERSGFSALDADKTASREASEDVGIVEGSLVHSNEDPHKGVDAKSTQTEPNTDTIVASVIVHGADAVAKCVQDEHIQAEFESASTDAVQGMDELSGIQYTLSQAQTQSKERLADCVQNDENLAGDQDSEADVENSQGSADGDEVEKLADDEHGKEDAQEIDLQCASDAEEVFLSLYGEGVEISQAAQSCETRNSQDRLTPQEQEPSRSYPDSGAGCTSRSDHTSEKEGMHVCDVNSIPGLRAQTDRTHEEHARQTELKQDIQRSSASEECGPVVIGSKDIQSTALHSVDVGAAEQTAEAGKYVLLNEKGHSDSSGSVHTDSQSSNAAVVAGISECVCVPEDNDQKEHIPVSKNTEEPASQCLVQEKEITVKKNETEDDHAVSRMEAGESAPEQVEKHSDDPMLMGGNVVNEFDGIVSEANKWDGDELLEEKPSEPAQGKTLSSEHQEDHSPKELVDSCPRQTGEQAEKLEGLLKEAMHLNSLSDPGTVVPWVSESLLLPDDNIQEQHLSEHASGDRCMDIEKPASQILVRHEESTDKHSEREEDHVSTTVADISPTKHLEKHIEDHMLIRAKAIDELDGGIIEAKQSDGEKIHEVNDGEWFSTEPEEEHSAKKLQKARKEGRAFGIGDLVWAKVRSHPWWPAQIFDPADASVSAKKIERSGRVLVAFFGDCTFGWLQQSQIIAFRSNFKEKVKQTTMKSFCKAIAEALEEFCRRSELGLNCSHYKGSLHSSSTFPDENAGIQKGVRVKNHKDISASVEMFKPDKIMEFVKGVACSPFGSWSSTLEASELRGHAYGLRTCMAALGTSNAGDLLQNMRVERAVSAYGSKLKRRFSSLETDDEAAAEEGKEAKKVNMGEKGRSSEGGGLSPTPRRLKTPISEETDRTEAIKSDFERDKVARDATDSGTGKQARLFKGSKKAKRDGLLCPEASSDTAVGTEAEGEKSPDDGTETLFALAGYRAKVLKRLGKGSVREDGKSGFIKNKVRRQSAGEAQDAKSISDSERADEVSLKGAAKAECKRASDSDVATSTRTETQTKDAFNFTPSDSEEKSFDADDEVSKGKKKSPAPLLDLKKVQVRTVEEKQQFNSLHLESRDGLKKASNVTKSKEGVVLKGQTQSSGSDTPKKEDVRKSNKAVKLGDSIRKVAGELTGTLPLAICVDESLAKSMGHGSKKETKGLASELPGSPKYKKAVRKESADERSHLSLVQLHQGLELLARDPLNNAGMSKPSGRVTAALFKFRTMVFKKSSGYGADATALTGERVGKAAKHSKKGDQIGDAKAVAIKSPPSWQIVAHRSQRPGLQELALAARKRKSEIVQEGVAKAPKKSPTSGPQGQHASKAVISTEKPVELRRVEKNTIQYSRIRPAPTASNVKSSSQRYDEKLSSQLPLGLFMRFPEDFALPSESQLKATFVPFGPLQASGTRVYKDSASAQVVFKHGRDAEFALKHAKKNAMFGQAAVTYRLRHSRADTKNSGEGNPSSRVDGRVSSLSSKERIEGRPSMSNASSQNRAEHGGTGTSSLSSKERIEGRPSMSNASSQNRAEHGGTGTSEAIQIPSNVNMASNSGSEPTGDIQDKMMTLLRQVSVIVGTSPVPSADAT